MSVIGRIERGELAICEDISSTMYSEWRMANQEINDKLLALAKQGEKMRWVPVEEGLPEDCKTVVMLLRTGKPQIGYLAIDKCEMHWWHDVYKYGFDSVTHWMPLPEPPGGRQEVKNG